MFRKTNATATSRSSGDRFIPCRRNNNFDLFFFQKSNDGVGGLTEKLNAASNTSGEYFLNVAKEENLVKSYKKLLMETLIPNNGGNILTFSSNGKKKRSQKEENVVMWPVVARTKPLISRPNIILDLPDIRSNVLFENIMDWSKSGYMATVHHGRLFIWHEKYAKSSLTVKGNTPLGGCLKWDLDGDYLVVASVDSVMHRLRPLNLGMSHTILCHCVHSCRVIAMEFTNGGKFISSCTNKKLCLFETKSYKLVKCHNVDSEVNKIVSSCHGTYFATHSKGRVMAVWTTDTLEVLYFIQFTKQISTMTFHPWKEFLLLIGGWSMLSLWNILKRKCVFQHKIPRGSVHCASFNPLSAELVVTYFCTGLHNMENGDNFIMILKNFDTIVDQVRLHKAPVLCLLWNGDGTKLASCGTDENICLWDFFGDSKNEKRFLNRVNFCELNEFKTLNMFGETIR